MPTTVPTTTPGGTRRPASAAAPPIWLILSRAVSLLIGDPRAKAALDQPTTLIVGTSSSDIPAGWSAQLVVSYTSYVDLHRALTDKTLPAGTHAVMYDNEGWQFTPLNEQQDPAKYMAMAATEVHAQGLQFIAAPAVTLMRVLAPNPGRTYDKFLGAQLPAAAAAQADYFDIQAQGSVSAPNAYTDIVTKAAAQARARNDNVKVLAGISTNPAGSVVTQAQLLESFRLTRPIVDGYWLNIPIPGPYCPNCNPTRADLALALLAAAG